MQFKSPRIRRIDKVYIGTENKKLKLATCHPYFECKTMLSAELQEREKKKSI